MFDLFLNRLGHFLWEGMKPSPAQVTLLAEVCRSLQFGEERLPREEKKKLRRNIGYPKGIESGYKFFEILQSIWPEISKFFKVFLIL